MEEEITITEINDTEGQQTEQQTQQQTEEQGVDTEQQTVEEVDDIEEITFDVEENLAGFNTSEFEDLINEDNISDIEEFLTDAQAQGLNQEQVNWLAKRILAVEQAEQEEANRPKTKREIQEQLNKVLTREEKANYQSIKGYVAKKVANNPHLSSKVDEIMANPSLIALLNEMYKDDNASKATGKLNTQHPKAQEGRMKRDVGLDEAHEVLRNALYGGDFEKVANEYFGRVNDVEGFKEILRAMGKLNVLK